MSEREWHHPDCDLGDVDHPGYLGYRCIDAHGCTLPYPEENEHGCLFPPVTQEVPHVDR